MPRSSWAAGRRLLSCAAAVALAISMIPAAAFATDGGTSQLNTTVATGRAASDVPNINVDVPATIALNDTTDPKGINIKNLGTVTGSAAFTNNSNNAIRIKEIKSNASGLNDYFTLSDNAKVTFSLGTTTTSGGNSTFTSVASANWKPTETTATSVYTVGATAKPSEGFVMSKGAKMDGKVDLNLTGSTLKEAAKSAAQDPTANRDLIKCTWIIESVRGMGDASDPNVDFYLTDKRNADHPVTYSLAEVKEDAEKLPSQSRGAWPYDMYYEFCTGDGSNYECKVRWNNELYPLRIIGLNQDEKASGGMAGLTFLFTQPMKTDTVTYSVGEGKSNTSWETSNARTWLNSGQGWTGLPAGVRGAIKQVKKISVHGDMGWGDRSTWKFINTVDSMFFLSFKELSTRATVANEPIGVGADKTEPYLIITDGPVRNPRDELGGQGWERDYNFANQMTYIFNNSIGAPTWDRGAKVYPYLPAFCL